MNILHFSELSACFCSLFGHTSALGSHGCWHFGVFALQSCQNDRWSQLQENTFCLFSQFTVVPNESFYLAARGANSAAAATNNKKSPAGFFFLLCIWPRLPDGSVKKLFIFLFILIADVNEKIFCQMLIFGAKIFTRSLKYEMFLEFLLRIRLQVALI